MQKAIRNDYTQIINLYNKYKSSFAELLKKAENVEDIETIWSNSYLDFYPYQSELNQLPQPKIYTHEPKSTEGIILNKIKDNELFYFYHMENKGWCTAFTVKDTNTKTRLLYFADTDSKMTLQQIYSITYRDSLIDKVLFYAIDEELDEEDDEREETFMVDTYSHNNNLSVNTITTNGFFESKSNILPTRVFRFEYLNDQIFIYSKQLLANNKMDDKLIYPGTPVKRNK